MLFDALRQLVLPTFCAGCGLPGQEVCPDCLTRLVRPTGPGCMGCGHPWSITVRRCGECPAGIVQARYGVSYCDPARPMMRAFKDEQRLVLAGVWAGLIAGGVPPPVGVLVPVPSTGVRIRKRGYNPPEEIARELCALWGSKCARLLERRGVHVDQRGASVSARRAQVRGAFHVVGSVAGQRVTLIDDVMTTGATLVACARALRRAGVTRVDAIVAARVDAHARSAR